MLAQAILPNCPLPPELVSFRYSQVFTDLPVFLTCFPFSVILIQQLLFRSLQTSLHLIISPACCPARQRILEVERVLIEAVGSLEPTESRRGNHQIHQEGDSSPGEDKNDVGDGVEDNEGVRRKNSAEDKDEMARTADAKDTDGQGAVGAGQGEKVGGVGGDDGRPKGNGDDDARDQYGNDPVPEEKGNGDGARAGESKAEDGGGGSGTDELDADATRRKKDAEGSAGESGGGDDVGGGGRASDERDVNGCSDGIDGGEAGGGGGDEGDGEAGKELLAQVWQDERAKGRAWCSK